MTTLISMFGMGSLLLLAYFLSAHRQQINWRTILVAFGLQFTLGAIALYIPAGKAVLGGISAGVGNVLGFAQTGIDFLFGDLGNFKMGFVFAIHVLSVVIFFSSLIAVLYHLGIMMRVINFLGGALQRLLGTSRTESMSATANIFIGQTEAPLVVRPFIATMTQSELFAVMVGGMSTIAGSVMAGYVGLGIELKYLIAASFMAAPGGLLMAKMILPETDSHSSISQNPLSKEAPAQKSYVNVIDAAASGASDGMKLAANIGAMLLAFVALIAMLNGLLGYLGSLVGFDNLSLELILGYLFKPVAFLLGIPWSESGVAGSFIGQKLITNEFVAYISFSQQMENISEHSQAIITFALCGFANLASLSIILGGLGTMAPNRREDIARLGLRAVLAGFMVNLMSAAIAGFFLSLS